MKGIIILLLLSLAITSIFMVIINIKLLFSSKKLGKISKTIMTIWSISLISFGFVCSFKVKSKIYKDKINFQDGFLYGKASSMFLHAKKDNSITYAKSALPLSQKSLDLDKKRCDLSINKHKKLVTDIQEYINKNNINKNSKTKGQK